MPYVCTNPEAYAGTKVGNGQCVAFVQAAARAPHTSLWNEGAKVRGGSGIPKGCAIATFVGGKYPNKATGNHAAIYISQTAGGIVVYDQWTSQGAVRKRVIRAQGGAGSPSNDADAFSVIE